MIYSYIIQKNMNKVISYLKLLRIKHYFKNILVFLPIIFSGQLFNKHNIYINVLAFVSFCLASSVVYIINDIRDVESDRKHPIKRNRPIASGMISIKESIVLLIIILTVLIIINLVVIKLNIVSIGILVFYILINIAYSFGLKNKPIIDIVILASGFVLRMFYGASISEIKLSNWLYLTVLSLSFYMGLGKRRNEIIKQGDSSRKVLKKYTKDFLDKNMYVFLTLCIIFYSLWCVDPNTLSKIGNPELLIWTVPFIMVIMMKYSLIIEGDSFGDPIDIIFSDKVLLGIAALYAILMFYLVYGGG